MNTTTIELTNEDAFWIKQLIMERIDYLKRKHDVHQGKNEQVYLHYKDAMVRYETLLKKFN